MVQLDIGPPLCQFVCGGGGGYTDVMVEDPVGVRAGGPAGVIVISVTGAPLGERGRGGAPVTPPPGPAFLSSLLILLCAG